LGTHLIRNGLLRDLLHGYRSLQKFFLGPEQACSNFDVRVYRTWKSLLKFVQLFLGSLENHLGLANPIQDQAGPIKGLAFKVIVPMLLACRHFH